MLYCYKLKLYSLFWEEIENNLKLYRRLAKILIFWSKLINLNYFDLRFDSVFESLFLIKSFFNVTEYDIFNELKDKEHREFDNQFEISFVIFERVALQGGFYVNS